MRLLANTFWWFVFAFVLTTQGWGASALTVADISVQEGTSAAIVVTVSPKNSSSAITVDYATSDGTAMAGTNYTSTSGTLNIPKNTTTSTITIPTINDHTVGGSTKNFTLTLSNPTNANLGAKYTATVTLSEPYYDLNEREFTQRKSVSIYGDYNVTGGSVMCQKNGSNCTWTYSNAWYNSDTKYTNDVSTAIIPLNSSSSTLVLPSDVNGSNIVWAGLYWQGHIHNSSVSTRSADISGYNQVVFRTPDNTNYTVTSDPASTNYMTFSQNGNSSYRFFYSCFADVTSLVQSSYSSSANTFTVGNLKASIGQDVFLPDPSYSWNSLKYGHYGGWALAVVYQRDKATQVLPAPVLKNVSIYDGYKILLPSLSSYPKTISIPISNFLTPTTGAFSSSMFFFAGAGEQILTTLTNGNTGMMSLTDKNGAVHQVSNAINPQRNVINDSYSYFGSNITAGKNFYPGLDLDVFDTSSFLNNSQTSTNMVLTASCSGNSCNEGFVSVMGFASQLYEPYIEIVKTSGSSGTITPGSAIDYTAKFTNTGKEHATNVLIIDDLTANKISDTPLLYLSDIVDRNATKIINSVKLSALNDTTQWHCPVGSTASGCYAYDANCSVDYTADPNTTATRVWCQVPTVHINDTATMLFTLNLRSDLALTQDIGISNAISSSFDNGVTSQSVSGGSVSTVNIAGTVPASPTMPYRAVDAGGSLTSNVFTKTAGVDFNVDILTTTGYSNTISELKLLDVSNGNAVLSSFGNTSVPNGRLSLSNINIQKAVRQAQFQVSDANGTYLLPDTFAIKPASLSITIPTTPFKAGDQNAITLTTDTLGYNQDATNLSASINQWLDLGGSALTNALKYTPLAGDLNITAGSFDVNTGNSTGAKITFPDVGRFTFSISDTDWASVDASDGTPLATRTIASGNIDVRFAPYSFAISNTSVENNNTAGYTYFSSDLAHSALIPMTVTAQNKNGVTTQNYSSGLYEQFISVAHTIVPAPTGYTETNNTINSTKLGFVSGVVTLDRTSVNILKFNFLRSYLATMMPLVVNGSSVNVSVVDTDNIAGSTSTGVGASSASFVYGRLNAISTDVFGASATPSVFVEFYAPSGVPSSMSSLSIFKESINAKGWYINSLDSSSTASILGVSPSQTIDQTTKTAFGGGITLPNISVSTVSKLTLYLRTNEWLWYGANAYNEASSCSSQPCLQLSFATDASSSNEDWIGDSKSTVSKTPSGKRDKKRTAW